MMANFDKGFVDGLFWKIVGIGSVASAAAYWLVTREFAASVLLGTVVTAINFRVVAFAARKMLANAADGAGSGGVWSVILGVKLILLFVLTYWCIVVLGADVIGFIIGYSVFLPAMTWQSLIYASTLREEEDDQGNGLDEADTKRS
ncbi:MAG: ATP synthase subunit I [Bradymonadaceae bacterium]